MSLNAILGALVGGLLALIGTIITVKVEGRTAHRGYNLKELEVTNEKLAEQVERIEKRLLLTEEKVAELQTKTTRLRSLLDLAVSKIFQWQRWFEGGCVGDPPKMPDELKEY